MIVNSKQGNRVMRVRVKEMVTIGNEGDGYPMKKLIILAMACALLMMGVFAGVRAESENTVIGTLTDAAMHSLVVTDSDGEMHSIAMDDDTEIVAGDGLLLEKRVKVDYKTDGEARIATTVTVLDSFFGVVEDGTMHTVLVKAESGLCLFDTNDDTQVNMAEGIVIGAPIEIAYAGSLDFGQEQQNVTVWAIYDGPEA